MIKVGNKVIHSSREDLGYGVIKETYPDGTCDVKFEQGTFSGLPISIYISAEKIIEEDYQDKIKSCIKTHRYEEARKLYNEYIENYNDSWWPDFNDFLDDKIHRYEYKLEEEKRKKSELERQKNIIYSLLDDDFINAENRAVFPNNEYCCDFKEYKNSWLKDYFTKHEVSSNLNFEQRLAVGDISHNCLLRARAGSGKTTVIKHKVDFILRHLEFLPEDIMVLAFNKTAANKVKKDLQTEFNHLTFQNARTFHSLAYQIVLPTQDLLFDIDSGSNAKQSQFVDSLLKHELNPAIKSDIYEFFRQEMKEVENLGSLLSSDDYYVMRRNSTQDTLKGDAVKSLGEKWIADFLFEHGIRYVYERSWYRDSTGKKGNYYPDFSLAINSKIPDVIIEHWGIDEFSSKKNVPEFWSKSWKQYREEMDFKREYWKIWNQENPTRQIIFLETSIRDTAQGREHFESILKQKLASYNIHITKRSVEDLIDSVVKKHTPKLARMILQYINKAKKGCLSPSDLEQKISNYHFSCIKEKLFIQLANRMYCRYQDEMIGNNKIDYDDLMMQAEKNIHQKKGDVVVPLSRDVNVILNDIKWIMIDEYQDFSKLFFNLIHAIRKYNQNVKLFCVGDNWQAINGFAGSNLKYFNDFKSYFKGATLLDLRNNYRSQDNIVKQGNKFMLNTGEVASIPKAKLPSQPIKKYLTNEIFIEQRKNVSPKDNPDYLFLSNLYSNGESTNIDVNATMARQFKLCYQIIKKYNLKETKFMIISRSNYQAYGYENLEKFKRKLKSCFSKQELVLFRNFESQVHCMTAHKSKGDEADVVILLNVKDHKFPIIHPDNQLYVILGDTQNDIYQEEERLFYVAITRPKQALYISTEKGQESEFLSRIDASTYDFSSLFNNLKENNKHGSDDIPF